VRQEERITQLARRLADTEEDARDLRQELARREAEIHRLTDELRERDARWARLESTRGFRLLNAYWNRRARGGSR
jgi:chromosome segregation ATPase